VGKGGSNEYEEKLESDARKRVTREKIADQTSEGSASESEEEGENSEEEIDEGEVEEGEKEKGKKEKRVRFSKRAEIIEFSEEEKTTEPDSQDDPSIAMRTISWKADARGGKGGFVVAGKAPGRFHQTSLANRLRSKAARAARAAREARTGDVIELSTSQPPYVGQICFWNLRNSELKDKKFHQSALDMWMDACLWEMWRKPDDLPPGWRSEDERFGLQLSSISPGLFASPSLAPALPPPPVLSALPPPGLAPAFPAPVLAPQMLMPATRPLPLNDPRSIAQLSLYGGPGQGVFWGPAAAVPMQFLPPPPPMALAHQGWTGSVPLPSSASQLAPSR